MGTAMYHSHSGEAVWKQVICGTVNGIPIAARTVANLGMRHETVVTMRHKELFCLEQEGMRYFPVSARRTRPIFLRV
jgi:hypothetical protein